MGVLTYNSEAELLAALDGGLKIGEMNKLSQLLHTKVIASRCVIGNIFKLRGHPYICITTLN